MESALSADARSLPEAYNNHITGDNKKPFYKPKVSEPIAVVGLSLRFPEDATSEDSFWDLMADQRCTTSEFPKERMIIDAYYSSDPKKSCVISTRNAHFLREDIRGFDAAFFSMAPQEAASLDPQQRGLLEMTYLALENAGIPIDGVKDSKTSVHVACFTTDFMSLIFRDPNQIGKYSGTGGGTCFLSNRLSWFYGFRGPSMQVDTACSSGLVALDLACNGLWSGESEMGIVAGSNLILSPELNIAFSEMGVLSPDGRCYSFDDRGNGYGRGEGIAVLVLKTLSKAIKDGDTIRALIRSTGTNQDGRTTGGLTQPSQESQSRLIDETYLKAGLSKSLTRFFEAHGTGTPIGDPIEAMAIGDNFRRYRSSHEPLLVGAVKSNVGHLEGASGLASLIKTIQFPLKNIPWPCDGIRRASVNSFGMGGTNSHVVLDDVHHYLQALCITANHRTVSSPPSLEKATAQKKLSDAAPIPLVSNPDDKSFEPPRLYVWSCANEASLNKLIDSYTSHFAKRADAESSKSDYLSDLAFTLNTRRSILPWKSYVVANSIDQLSGLRDIASKPVQSPSSKPNLAFVFTGQGAQWFGMGRELLIYPAFRESILKSEYYIFELSCPWKLTVELAKSQEDSRVNEPEFSQPLCTAVQIALVDLLRVFGVLPSVVVGHSSGEIASAYSMGAISARAAMKLSYHRGTVASKLARAQSAYCMAAVGLSEQEMSKEIEEMKNLQADQNSCQITVSCVNSLTSTTISGPVAQVDSFVAYLKTRQIFARKLQVSVGYHSPQMTQVESEYLHLIGTIERGTSSTKCRMVSSVTGETISTNVLCTPQYWVQNMISKVDFLGAVQRCCSQTTVVDATKKLDQSHLNKVSVDSWLEIGPHAALQGPIRSILTSVKKFRTSVTYNSVLLRDRSAVHTLLEAMGHLYCQGSLTDLSKVDAPISNTARHPAVLTNLPQYTFDHSVLHWHESRLNREHRLRKYPHNELLGTRATDWNSQNARWNKIINLNDMSWAKDHRINGSILYPAAGILSMAIEAVKQLDDDSNSSAVGYELKDVIFNKPLILSTHKNTETQISLRSTKDQVQNKPGNIYEFCVSVYKEEELEVGFQEICRGYVRADHGRTVSEVDHGKEEKKHLERLRDLVAAAEKSVDQEIDPGEMYRMLREAGIDHGPVFQSLRAIQINNNSESIGKVGHSELLKHLQSNIIHPTILDGLFQMAFVSLSKGNLVGLQTMIPVRLDRLWVASSGAGGFDGSYLTAHAHAKQYCVRTAQADIFALSDDNKSPIKVEIKGLHITAISRSSGSPKDAAVPKPLCYDMVHKVDIDTLSPSQIQKYCEAGHKQAIQSIQDIEWMANLKWLVLSFGADALEQLKRSNHEPQGHLKRYAVVLQSQIDRALAETPEPQRAYRQSLLEDASWRAAECNKDTTSLGGLYFTVGQRLAEVLLGNLDPLQLIFEGQNLVDRIYEELHERTTSFQIVGRYLEALAHKNPGMNILEIGAGTGATTKFLNQKLGFQKYSTYDFTDIGKSFLAKAADVFGDNKRMNFKVLDIEKDPSTQGFEEGSYDIIIAANVLHATSNLCETILHTRKLLKPGGKLILIEGCDPHNCLTSFIFGLLPGWWLSSEGYRQDSPCITEVKWDAILKQNNFSGLDLLLKDFDNVESHICSLMVTTATGALIPSPSIEWKLVLNNKSGLQTEIAQKLEQHMKEAGEVLGGSLTLMDLTVPNLKEGNYIVLIELDHPVIRNMSAKEFEAIQILFSTASKILWVTSGGGNIINPDYSPIQGLTRVLRQEVFGVPFTTLALEDSTEGRIERHTTNIAKIVNLMSKSTNKLEPEYKEIDGFLNINRVSEATAVNNHIFERTNCVEKTQEFGEGQPLQLSVKTPGLIDSIEFIEDRQRSEPLGADEIEIEVHAAGVNFRDLLQIIGKVASDVYGCEGAGIVTRVGENCTLFYPGDRVMMTGRNVFRSYARCHWALAMKVPPSLTFPQAASIPVAFTTAWYSLNEVSSLQPGETVLIHSGAGGTGQALIQVAQLLGSEIFTTVSSAMKKQYLMKMYDIREDHIFFSRDDSFADGIMRMTQGKGVDVIVNSVSGEKLAATWECIAPFGRMIEIGLGDVFSHGKLDMYPFARNTMFAAVNLDDMAVQRPLMMSKPCRKVMELVADNKLQPFNSLEVLSISDLRKALRALQGGKHIGKMVVEFERKAKVLTSLKSRPSYAMDPNVTYLVAGGLGGLGRSIARWLVASGAQNLILVSRSGPQKEEAQRLLIELKSQKIRVETPQCDITDLASLQSLIDECASKMPPIKGCFQTAMVLKDARFFNMKFQEWEHCVNPKISGSWNLHTVLPQGMDFFILLSSTVGIIGHVGQSNYAAGNTYQDALAQFRVTNGEKATAIDLGVVLGAGFVAENPSVRETLQQIGSILPLDLEKLFALFDLYCDPKLQFQSPIHSQVITGLGIPSQIIAEGKAVPSYLYEPMFLPLHQMNALSKVSQDTNEGAPNYKNILAACPTVAEAGLLVANALRSNLSKILGISEDDIELRNRVESYGIDSLVAVELRNWFGREMGADLAVFEILGANFLAVGLTVATKSSFRKN